MDFTSQGMTAVLTGHVEMSTMYHVSVPVSNLTGYIGSQSENRTDTHLLPGLLSDTLSNILNTVITQISLPIIEVSGIVANIINLFVFWTIGLNDSVTSSFFALSLSDMCYLLSALFVWICFTLDNVLSPQHIRFGHLGYMGIFYCHLILAVSILITTYIAIQRCCCVVLPLKFKGVFTSRRNAVVITVICVVSAALYIPIISNQGMKTYFNVATNSSWYGLWFSKDRKYILGVTDFLAGTLFPIAAQIVTVICMILLTSSLRQSSKFRQKATSVDKDQSSEMKTSSKEIQVVKAVTLVTLLFITSNVPPICIALTRRFVPTFDIYKRYTRLFNVTNVIKDAIQYLNASLNIVVYYNFNSTYRSIFKQFFWSKFGWIGKSTIKKFEK